VATAYELLRQSKEHVGLGTPVEIALFDAHGIASGGSGAAAGLLHPYSPKGKPLWKGAEALQVALELIQAAQQPTYSPEASLVSNQASDPEGDMGPQHAGGGEYEHAEGESSTVPPFVWQHGVFRCAADGKQVSDMVGAQMAGLQPAQPSRLPEQQQQQQHSQHSLLQPCPEESSGAQQHGSHGLKSCPAQLVSAQRLQQLLPGIQVPTLMSWESQAALSQERHDSTRDTGMSGAVSIPDSSSIPDQPQGLSRGSAAAGSAGAMGAGSTAGFFVPEGLVLSVPQYLQQLWVACQAAAAARDDGSSAVLHKQQISSIAELQHAYGPFHVVVVAAGAAVGALADAQLQSLPLRLSQGYTLVMEPRDEESSYPPAAPSMLGQPYMAAQGQRLLVIGATQQYGFTPEASLAMCKPEQRIAYRTPADAAAGAPGPYSGQEAHSAALAGTEQVPASKGASVAAQQCATSFQCRWLPGLEGESDKGKVEAVVAAAAELLYGAMRVWPLLSRWRIREVRSGVRAMPPRAASSSMPLLGRLEPTLDPKALGIQSYNTGSGSPLKSTGNLGSSITKDGRIPAKSWLFVGLGARGLLYHALFARQLAAAILLDDEQLLDPELRAWRSPPSRKC